MILSSKRSMNNQTYLPSGKSKDSFAADLFRFCTMYYKGYITRHALVRSELCTPPLWLTAHRTAVRAG